MFHHWVGVNWVGWGCMTSCGKKMQTSERESREGCWHCCLLSCEARQGRMVEWKRDNLELEQLMGTSHYIFTISIFSTISSCSLMKRFAIPLNTLNCFLNRLQWKPSAIMKRMLCFVSCLSINLHCRGNVRSLQRWHADFNDTHLRASGPLRHLASASLRITASPHCIWIP